MMKIIRRTDPMIQGFTRVNLFQYKTACNMDNSKREN